MDNKSLMRKWMLAHVRLQSVANPESWSNDDLLHSFLTLQTPVMSFEEWCESINELLDDPIDIEAENEKALVLLKTDNHEAVKIGA